MKVLILYYPDAEHSRAVEEFVHEFERQHTGRNIELLSLSSREGATQADLYDVMDYPAILALADDGQLLKHWQGATLPLMRDVAGYATASTRQYCK